MTESLDGSDDKPGYGTPAASPCRIWKLYGKEYRLDDYIQHHPGGSLAILLGSGIEDATPLFEAYHIKNRDHAQTVLLQSKNVVVRHTPSTMSAFSNKDSSSSSSTIISSSPAFSTHLSLSSASSLSSPSLSPVTTTTTTTSNIIPLISSSFSAFHDELVEAARSIPGGTKMPWSRIFLLFVCGIFYTVSWIGWIQGYVWSLLTLPFLAWIFGANLSHDAAHFAASSRPWINTLCAFVSSPLLYNTHVWYLQHNILHHMHTNVVGADTDLHHMAPFVRLHLDDESGNYTAQSVQVAFIAVGSLLSTLVQSVIFPLRLAMGKGMGTDVAEATGNSYAAKFRLLSWEGFTLGLQWFLSVTVLLYPLIVFHFTVKGWVFALVPYMGASFWFMLFTQISHIQEITQRGCGCTECVRNKPCRDNKRMEKKNFYPSSTSIGHSSPSQSPNTTPPAHWAEQMVATSLDYAQSSWWIGFLSAGLNMQGLHHCLPSVSSAHYHQFYPTYRSIAIKHGIPIRETASLGSAIIGYWSHLANLQRDSIQHIYGTETINIGKKE